MSIPTAIAAHQHISERETAHTWPTGEKDDSKWEDCAWCSAVMWARLCIRSSIPATHKEAESLRHDAGEKATGGSGTADLIRGIKKRYGVTPATVTGAAALWAYLSKPGRVAVAMGNMGVFPVGYTLRRFSPSFAGGHALMVARVDGNLRVWWDDPLAPTGTYQGQWVTYKDLMKLVKSFGPGFEFLVGEVPEGDSNVAQKAITSDVPATVDVKAGTALFDLDGVTKRTSLSIDVKGRLSPYAVGTQRAIYATTSGVKRLYLCTPVTGSVKPIVDTTPYNQSQLDAAKAEGVTVGTVAATTAEKSRVRQLLGL